MLVFSNNYNGGGGGYTCNKISMFGGGNTPTTSGHYGFGVSSYTTYYFSTQYHRFRYGLSIGGTNFGSVGMELNNNNLSVNGAIYAATTIQSSGVFYFASSLWHNCNDGNDRFYFEPNSTTYIRGAGSSMVSRNITFRNGADNDLGWYEWNSVLYGYGFVKLSDRRRSK